MEECTPVPPLFIGSCLTFYSNASRVSLSVAYMNK